MDSIVNAPRYSGRQVKLVSPPKKSSAARSEVARKKSKVRQKTLNVTMRWNQTDQNPSPDSSFTGNRTCSMSNATPWIAPKTTYVQLAPCHRPAMTMVIRRFLDVFHGPPAL